MSSVTALCLSLLVPLLVVVSAIPDPRRAPKIYNAVITSSENLEPSRAYPIVQPVLRPAALAYQIQLPYIPTNTELAAYLPLGYAPYQQSFPTVTTYNNPVKGDTNVGHGFATLTTYPAGTQAKGIQNYVPSNQQSINNKPGNQQPYVVPNSLYYQQSEQNIAQSYHTSSNIAPNLDQQYSSYPANIGAGNQVKIEPQVGPNVVQQQQAPQPQTYPINIGAAGYIKTPEQTNVAPQYVVQQVANVAHQGNANVGQQTVQNSAQAITPNNHQHIAGQQLLPNPGQVSNVEHLNEQQVVQQNVRPNIQKPVRSSAPNSYSESILNNNYKHRNPGIPDVPPPPLPTTRRRSQEPRQP